MAGDESFWALLERLANRRQLNIRGVAGLAGVAEPELMNLSEGSAPSPSQLRRLAPALGLHAADLFAIAGVEIPDDLAPVDPEAGKRVPYLLRYATALPWPKRPMLHQFVASLPQREQVRPVPRPPVHENYPAGPGGVLMRLARNRNLSWTATAMTFLVLTGRYWSAATYGAVGRGRVQLTPELLADFSRVLDVPGGDLVALTGVALPDTAEVPDPAADGMAELIWNLRRLTPDQIQQASDVAKSMLR